jgi:hypothetical protein
MSNELEIYACSGNHTKITYTVWVKQCSRLEKQMVHMLTTGLKAFEASYERLFAFLLWILYCLQDTGLDMANVCIGDSILHRTSSGAIKT